MPTAFLTFTASFSVSSSLKFLPMEIGHLFHFGTTRLPTPSKTHRCGLVSKSCGSQLIVNDSKFRFLYLPRLNPDLRLGCLPSASTRITEMNECEKSGLFHLFW